MSGTHNKLQHGNNFNHWKVSDFVADLNYFSFSTPKAILNRDTYLNTNYQVLIVSFISVFGMYNITLCMHTWYEVRNFAWHQVRKKSAESLQSRLRQTGSGPISDRRHTVYLSECLFCLDGM